MSKKTSKHRPAKRVKTPTKPAASPPATVVTFFTETSASGQRHHYWHAMRCGKVVAESSGCYSRKEKMKRSFLKLVDSFACRNWIAKDESKP